MNGTKTQPTTTELLIESLVVFLIIAALILVTRSTWSAFDISYLPLSSKWIISVLGMVVILGIIGYAIQRRVDGVLIDERNMISLSRFQMVLWTVIVLATLLTLVGGRARAMELGSMGAGDPLAVEIPEALWILMGISTVSLVGSPFIRSVVQTNRRPDVEKILPNLYQSQRQIGLATALPRSRSEVATRATTDIQSTLNSEGRDIRGNVFVNLEATGATGAKWTDLFRGELVSNSSQVDMTKLQNFFFTVILVMVYVAAIFQQLSQATIPNALPEVTSSVDPAGYQPRRISGRQRYSKCSAAGVIGTRLTELRRKGIWTSYFVLWS